jgi:hypothetical protein
MISQEIRSATISVGFDDLPDPSYEDDFVDDGDDYRDDSEYMRILENDEALPESDYEALTLERIAITLDGDTSSELYYDDSGIDFEEVEPEFDDEGHAYAHLPLRDDLASSNVGHWEGLDEELDRMRVYSRGIIDTHELYMDGLCPVHVYHATQAGVLLGSNDDINYLRSPRAYWPLIEVA